MISICQNTPMIFNKINKKIAYIVLKSIGLPRDKCPNFSKKNCIFIESELNIPSDRIYIDFCDIDKKMFGRNKNTF